MAETACSVDLVIVSEILCYIQNNISNASKSALLTAVSGFYSGDEIIQAKHKLFEIARELFTHENGLCAEGLPRQSSRRGEN
jgi:hypothetical protein